MKAFFEPKGLFPILVSARRGARTRPGTRMACVLVALGLGACAPLTTLPDPPGSGEGAREFPGPFDGYDSARPPAYKAPPTPSPPPPAPSRGENEEDEPDFGGIFRPGLPWPPWGRDR